MEIVTTAIIIKILIVNSYSIFSFNELVSSSVQKIYPNTIILVDHDSNTQIKHSSTLYHALPVTVWPDFCEIRFLSILELCRVGQVEEVDVLEERDRWTQELLECCTPWLHHHSLYCVSHNYDQKSYS